MAVAEPARCALCGTPLMGDGSKHFAAVHPGQPPRSTPPPVYYCPFCLAEHPGPDFPVPCEDCPKDTP